MDGQRPQEESMSARTNEHGKGTISSIIWMLVFAGFIYASWNVAPAYIAHYSLQDKMVELCRLGRSGNPDQKILDILMKKVREEELMAYIHPQDFTIVTQEGSRRITVSYDRQLKVLPGYVRTVHFEGSADQPVAF
jgi:hypothetical protein